MRIAVAGVRWLRDPLVRSGVLLMAFGFVANVFSYAFHVAMAHMLTLEQFGTLSAVLAGVGFVEAGLLPAQLFVAQHIAQVSAADHARLQPAIARATRIAVWSGALVGGVLIVASLLGAFGRGLGQPIGVFVGASLAGGFPTAVLTGVLQGEQRFLALGVTALGVAALRFCAALLAVAAGLGVLGALGGDILRPIVWLALLLVFVAPFARDRQRSPVPTASQARSSLVVTAVGVLTVAALTSLDVLVAKLLFPADEAGLYAGLSVVGKAVLFVGVTFGTVMFPIASERAVLGRDSRGLLARAIACTLALSGLATLAIALMPQLVASLLVGASFQAAVGLLPLMGVAASMLGIVQLLLLYFMARGDGRTVALGVGFLVIEAALIAAFHASLRAMVLDVAAGAAIAALAGVALAFGSRVPDAPPAQAE